MTKLTPADFNLLYYFSVVASECNLRMAAKRLNMSQPPLSRHMSHLEALLEISLFTRHSRGLELTKEGRDVLTILTPLLEMQQDVFHQLENLTHTTAGKLFLGLTTAFEQGIFAELEAELGAETGIVRKSSPLLARDVQRGRLDAAIVALPLEAPGLHIVTLPYEERLALFAPTKWRISSPVNLSDMNGKPLFWFDRRENPAWFDHMKAVFSHLEFKPAYISEPSGHDVLLARIAAGEGMAIMPESFNALKRDNIACLELRNADIFKIQCGMIYTHNHAALEIIKKFFSHSR